MEPRKNFNVLYRFRLSDGKEESYEVKLDRQTLDLLDNAPAVLPQWSNLDFQQCPNCPLTIKAQPHCPTAVSLVKLMTLCNRLLSYDKVYVEIITSERIVSMDTTAQAAISSFMGLVIACSGCPHTAFFKPLARFHLPLSNEDETIFRAASMYLLAQYFVRKQGRPADLELEGLKKIYSNMHLVNLSMAKRLRAASDMDSAVNALVILDLFTKTLPYVIEDSLEELRYLFSHFLE